MTSINFLKGVIKEVLTLEETEAKYTLVFYNKI